MAGSSSSASPPAFHRLILKLSGEALARRGEGPICTDRLLSVARQAAAAAARGVQIAVVVGGGNILRGAQFTSGQSTIREVTGHDMGMLATVINGLALQDALESVGCVTRLMTALRMDSVAEPYIRRRAKRHLEKGRIIILAGGTGSPFVTTDTAAAQKALELEAEILLKATRVDGVYSDDPETNPRAVLYRRLTHATALDMNLEFMDRTAVTQCKKYGLPILVFNFDRENSIQQAVAGQQVGTLITRDGPPLERAL